MPGAIRDACHKGCIYSEKETNAYDLASRGDGNQKYPTALQFLA
jgi:hypothetical protein